MKLRYRFLFPALIAVACAMAAFGSAVLGASFAARFGGERDKLGRELRATANVLESSYANYALQNMDAGDEQLREIACRQGAMIAELGGEGERSGAIRLSGRVLRAETPLRLGEHRYLLTVESDLSELYEERAALITLYRASYAAAILFVAGIMAAIARSVTKPLSELAEVSAALAEGNLTRRAPILSDDEIGGLARSFNRMSDELTDQLARRTRFINDLTHEMKTPLSAMIGHAERIRSGRLGEEDMLIAAQTILREGKRLDALARAMTEWILFKNEALSMHEMSVHMLFRDALGAFVESPQNLRIAESSQDVLVYGNRALLTALLTNLIQNALNAGAAEVTLASGIECAESPAPSGRSENGRSFAATVRITVADDGCGISKAELQRVMEPFYRVDKARSREVGGVGLGLALCREIAQIHGATLRLESAPGAGTKAIFEIRGREVEEDA